MKKAPPYLIVISAPSGAGKTTLCNKLLEDFPDIELSVSSTSRQPRGSEEEGVDYYFLTKQEFEKQIQEGRFAEWALVHGNYYGTSKENIQKAFQQKKSVLLDIDVQGAELLRKAFPKQCYRIFISPPSMEELEFRLRTRKTDSEESIQKRLVNAKTEIAAGQSFDSIIVNDALDRAYGELKSLLETQLGLKTRGT